MPDDLQRLRVSIYNPNFTNPYALEVANVLADGQFEVTVWNARSNRSTVPDNVRARPILAGERGSQIAVLRIRDRLLGPLRVAISVGREDVLIVAWLKDPWDSLVMKLRARLFGRTLFVHHNPQQIRGEGRTSKRERALMRFAPPVVHTPRLLKLVQRDYPSAKLAGHPPYANMVRSSGPMKPSTTGPLAFVGTLREDKGAHLLPELARRTSGGWTIRFIGAGPIPATLRDDLSSLGVVVENFETDYHPDDADLVRSLSQCRALLAPYTAVTTSGTMILAETLGLPVIALGLDPDGVSDASMLTAALDRMSAQIATPTHLDSAQAGRTLREWLAEVHIQWARAIEEVL